MYFSKPGRRCFAVFNTSLSLAFLVSCGLGNKELKEEGKPSGENTSTSDANESAGALSLSLPVEDKGGSADLKVWIKLQGASGKVLEKSFAYSSGQKIDIEKVPAGAYKFLLELRSASGLVESGSSEIEVIAGKTVQANLVLHPAEDNDGKVSIIVSRPGVPAAPDMCSVARPAICHVPKTISKCEVQIGEKLYSAESGCSSARWQLVESLCREKISVSPALFASFKCSADGSKPSVPPADGSKPPVPPADGSKPSVPPVKPPSPSIPHSTESGVILDLKSVIDPMVGINNSNAFSLEISGRVMLGSNACTAAGATANLNQIASSPLSITFVAEVKRPNDGRNCADLFAPVYAPVKVVFQGKYDEVAKVIVQNVDKAGNEKVIPIIK